MNEYVPEWRWGPPSWLSSTENTASGTQELQQLDNATEPLIYKEFQVQVIADLSPCKNSAETATTAPPSSCEFSQVLANSNTIKNSTPEQPSATVHESSQPDNQVLAVSAGQFGSLNVGDLLRQAQRYGVDLVLEEDNIRITAAWEVPNELLNALARKAPQVIRRLHKLETDQELKRRFGSFSRHGRLCRGCLTISLVRVVGGIEKCDECLLALTRGIIIDAITREMIGGAA